MPHYYVSPTFWFYFGGSFAATLLLTPLVMRLARQIGALDRGGHRKVHQGRPIPLLGGLAIGLPFLCACLLGVFPVSQLLRTIAPENAVLLWVLACGSVAILALGMADDRFGMKARTKFAGQFLIAALICWKGRSITGIHIPGFEMAQLDPKIGWPLTMLWIVGLTNAYNLVDGIDGLAAGLALIGALGLAVISTMHGNTFAALLCISLAGSLAGFLCFNFAPAKIFLGDTGSMFLGFALANIALMGSMKSSGTAILIAPLLVLALPVIDMAIAMVRRYLRGRPIFTGDQGHMHHRLLRQGFTVRGAMLTLCMFAVAMTATSVAALSTPRFSAPFWIALSCYSVALLGLIWHTGYLDVDLWRRMSQGRRHNEVLNAFVRYTSLKLSRLNADGNYDTDHIMRLICRELCLHRLEVITEGGQRLLTFDTNLNDDGQEIRAEEYGADTTLRVQSRTGGILQVSYQTAGLPLGLEAHDIESCLARILEIIELRPVVSINAPSPSLLTQGENVA